MSKIKILGLALVLSMPASSLFAQDFSDGVEGAENMIQAQQMTAASQSAVCKGKEVGEACSYENFFSLGYSIDSQIVTGTCQGNEAASLSCTTAAE